MVAATVQVAVGTPAGAVVAVSLGVEVEVGNGSGFTQSKGRTAPQ